MKINIASLLKSQISPANSMPTDSISNPGQFSNMIGRSMHLESKHPFMKNSQTPPNGQIPIDVDYPKCLQALRSGLLAKGKPFDRIYLKREDLALVQNLLTRLGFTPAKADQCLQDLLAGCQGGDLKLSQLFAQLEKLGPPKEKHSTPLVLTSSAAPYLESILNEFQLSENEIRKVLSSGRTLNGDLDFNKVVQDLEKVCSHRSRQFSGIVDLEKSQTITQDLQRLGIEVPTIKQTGTLHIEDFVMALKRMANILNSNGPQGKTAEFIEITPEVLKHLRIPMPQTGGRNPVASGAGGAIPAEAQTAINQVLEHAVVDGQKNDSLTSMLTDSKIKFDDPVAKQLQADQMPTKNAQLNPQMAHDSQSGLNGESQKFAPGAQANTPKLVTDTSTQVVHLQDMTEPELLRLKSQLKPTDQHLESIESRRFETLWTTAAKNQRSTASLPNYLVDQLGRQISRAINRGDGIIRFQLKPPELGFIKLEMQLADNQLNLAVAAENNSVKEMLLTHMHELREALLSQGIKIDKLDVHINDGFSQSLTDSQEGPNKEKRSQNGTNSGESFLGHDDAPESFFHDRASPRKDVIIDLVA